MSNELEPSGLTGTVHPPREARTDAKKLEVIAYLVDTHTAARNGPDGDKYLSEPEYLVEAIEAVLGDYDNGMLRAFLEAPAREEDAHELEEWQ